MHGLQTAFLPNIELPDNDSMRFHYYPHFKNMQAGPGLETKISDSKLPGDAPGQGICKCEGRACGSLLTVSPALGQSPPSAPGAPWPAVPGHSILARHCSASRSGSCISPASSPITFQSLGPSSCWSLMPGMYFFFLNPL